MRSTFAKRILDNTPKETKIFVNLYADILMRINQLLEDNAMSQKDLSTKMGKRPSEINKWLTGTHNFTLKSLAKLEAELDAPIIHVPHCRTKSSLQGKTVRMTVYENHRDTNVKFSECAVLSVKNANTSPLANVG